MQLDNQNALELEDKEKTSTELIKLIQVQQQQILGQLQSVQMELLQVQNNTTTQIYNQTVNKGEHTVASNATQTQGAQDQENKPHVSNIIVKNSLQVSTTEYT